jgi:predicted transcriptional regulator YheO
MTRQTSRKTQREKTFALLQEIGMAIVKTLGDSCEVVVHDLAQPDSSIRWIGGNVTGRCVGGPTTDLGLTKLRTGDFSPLYNYTTRTSDGKTLKSSSIFLTDDDGTPYAALCINLDITPFLAFEHALAKLLSRDSTSDVDETFSSNVSDVLDELLAECIAELGKPVELMQAADRIRLLALSDQRGAFQLKKAVPLMAARLGVSRNTIYNYLKEARKTGPERQEWRE